MKQKDETNLTAAAMDNLSAPASLARPRPLLKSLLRARLAVIGLVMLFGVILAAAAAPLIAPHDPELVELKARLKPPAWSEGGTTEHLLGTDSLGRDTLSRLIYGSRISVLVAFTVVALAGTLGTFLGVIAGYFGGWIDDVLMRIADIQLAFPFILLAISVLAVLGPGLLNIILVLGVTGWVSYARVARGQVISLREKEFIEAAHAVGVPTARILLRHILPNIMAPIIVIASFDGASVIIAEAALSFLGLGIPPSIPTWGSMLADGREYLYDAWWLATLPGVAIMITVLGINAVGDWIRDYLDPSMSITT